MGWAKRPSPISPQACNTQLNKAGKLDLHHVLVQLAQQNINSVLLEAGPKLIGAMVEEGLVDEFILYTAPILMGSHATSMMALAIQQMDECLALNIRDIRMVGNDILAVVANLYFGQQKLCGFREDF
jgi:diaminohydroxyphosphoribosylaminopyrimidine deaminase/5-amino-6-(5-phosphoribosylamino)uracil reductase